MFANGSVSEFDFLAIRWMHEWAEAHHLLKTRLLTPTKKCFFVEHESSSSKLYKVCHGKHLLVLTNTLQPQSTRK